MNPAISCIEDTLRLLLLEAKQAKETAAAKRGGPEEGFEVGRSEALAEALHTWANQLQTFGLDAQLDGAWEELRAFLSNQGY
jgi:flagellar biosynthesis/type III secretory pathway protein FliH